MSRRATDRVKQYHLMSAVVTPAQDVNGIIHVTGTSVVLAATVIDPDSASPYVYKWEQSPVSDANALFGSAAASTTTLSPLLSGYTYYIKLSVTNSQSTKLEKTFRILVA
jgi:sporulation-control protein spo0M